MFLKFMVPMMLLVIPLSAGEWHHRNDDKQLSANTEKDMPVLRPYLTYVNPFPKQNRPETFYYSIDHYFGDKHMFLTEYTRDHKVIAWMEMPDPPK